MTTTTALADALLKTPSLIGGLLSQAGATGDALQNGAFSDLLNQSGGGGSPLSALSAALSANAAISASPVAAATDTTASSGTLLQKLDQLANGLHKALDLLQQNKNNSKNSASSDKAAAAPAATAPTQAQTQSAATPVAKPTVGSGASAKPNAIEAKTAASAAGNVFTKTKSTAGATASTAATVTDTAVTVTASDDSDGDKKLITDIIAELLLMTQLVMQNVKQAQNTGDTATVTSATTSTDSLGGAASQAAAALNAGATDALLSPAPAASAPLAAVTPAATPATTDAADLAAQAADPFAQLLDLIEQTAQRLADTANTNAAEAATANAGAQAAATLALAAPAPTTLTATADLAAQLAKLNDGLKTALTALQKQPQLALASLKAAAQDNAAAAATATDNLIAAPTADARTASEPSSWQNQLFTTAPSQQQASAQPAQQPTSGQAFAQAAAMAAAADKNSGSASTGSGDMSDNNGGAAGFAASVKDAAPATNGEGIQATGTYNFASQLSAFRAANGGSTGLPTAVDQVILQMNRAVKGGNDQMSLQLQPGDLGKITIKLDIGSDGKVQGTVIAENPKTLDMLQKDSRSLERALQDAGLRADSGSLQFSLGGQGQHNNAGQNAQAKSDSSADGTLSAKDIDGLADLGPVAESYYITPGGVNIRV